jgi:hypothetical protein
MQDRTIGTKTKRGKPTASNDVSLYNGQGGTLMMEAVRTSETSVHFNMITRRYVPKDSKLYTRTRENLKSHVNRPPHLIKNVLKKKLYVLFRTSLDSIWPFFMRYTVLQELYEDLFEFP